MSSNRTGSADSQRSGGRKRPKRLTSGGGSLVLRPQLSAEAQAELRSANASDASEYDGSESESGSASGSESRSGVFNMSPLMLVSDSPLHVIEELETPTPRSTQFHVPQRSIEQHQEEEQQHQQSSEEEAQLKKKTSSIASSLISCIRNLKKSGELDNPDSASTTMALNLRGRLARDKRRLNAFRWDWGDSNWFHQDGSQDEGHPEYEALNAMSKCLAFVLENEEISQLPQLNKIYGWGNDLLVENILDATARSQSESKQRETGTGTEVDEQCMREVMQSVANRAKFDQGYLKWKEEYDFDD